VCRHSFRTVDTPPAKSAREPGADTLLGHKKTKDIIKETGREVGRERTEGLPRLGGSKGAIPIESLYPSLRAPFAGCRHWAVFGKFVQTGIKRLAGVVTTIVAGHRKGQLVNLQIYIW